MEQLIDLSAPDFGLSPEISVETCGSPLLMDGAMVFDGHSDGLIFPEIFLPGAHRFRIEIMISPSAEGPEEQRFFHMQADGSDDRFLMEIRLRQNGSWYADTCFVSNGKIVILQNIKNLHLCNAWHLYTVVYDGECLTHYINGVLEVREEMHGASLPLTGCSSIGIRQNKTYPFCGSIGSVIVLKGKK